MLRSVPSALLLLLMAAGCARPLHYTMLAPQISGENRYIGPEVEIAFRFAEDRLGILVTNTSEGELTVDWRNCSFVTADGQAVRLVPVGDPPVEKLPPGARFAAVLTLDRWSRAGKAGAFGHRRESLGRRLVYSPQLRPGMPAAVKVHLALVYWEVDDMGIELRRDENLAFEFAVQDPGELDGGKGGAS
ncbi:MAG: hypothetical protein FJ098_03530 [Deltaproteobacteria bacterium]|nr:hypothetical protein [Deltaproteobacteria bacterium]